MTGCAQPFHVRPTAYDLRVQLDPEKHTLAGRAVLTLEPIPDRPIPAGDVWVALDLNRDLTASDVTVDGARLQRTRKTQALYMPDDHKDEPIYRSLKLYLDAPAVPLHVTVDYHGTLQQDVAGGEKAGEIHNFQVSAHVAPEGTYLAPDGHWYPSPSIERADTIDPDLLLADWRLEVDPVAGYEFIASAERVDSDARRHVWAGPRRYTGLTLTGGSHDVWSRRIGDVDVHVHLKHTDDPDERAANETVAANYLDRTADYLQRYEALLGPFPYAQYTIVENFFSSGFAFPAMTLFGPVVMHMGDNSFRHGYLDHEMVHSWWGCGVEVDPRDGNWCEALTSYCTNYYGFIADGDQAGARKTRRDQSNFLSRIKPEDDKPVGTYGLKDGAGRGIAYSKGAAVFHMIAREIGQENFWDACRILTQRFNGKHADWADLQAAFEETSGLDLDNFFQQWIRGVGAPTLTLQQASYDASAQQLTVTIDQGGSAFQIALPLRLQYADSYQDVVVNLDASPQTVVIPAEAAPDAVELDPDYHVFRKLKPSEIMPTTATTKSAKSLAIVVPAEPFPDAYKTVADSFEETVKKKNDHELWTGPADDRLTPDRLTGGSVLVLGDAVRHSAVQALLERTVSPVRWIDGGFTVDDRTFTQPNHAVLFTVHHPDRPQDGITVYAGNGEEALANAAILGFYANSLLVFEAHDRTEVVLRRDFESHERLDVVPAD